MARIRYIKPEFFEDSRIGELSVGARLMFIGLWTLMDRNGLLEATPQMIRARLFAFDDMPIRQVNEWLVELIDQGRLRRVRHDGKELLFCPTLRKHQKFHVREQAKYIISLEELQALEEHLPSTCLAPNKPEPSRMGMGMGMGNGVTGRTQHEAPEEKPLVEEDFRKLYEKYPRKLKPTDAIDRCKRLIKSREDYDLLSAAIDRFVKYHRETGTDPNYLPYMTTFLGVEKRQCWRDWLDPETGTATVPATSTINLIPKELEP